MDISLVQCASVSIIRGIANGVFWCENSKILFSLFFYTQCSTRFSRIYIQVLFLQTLDIVNLVYIKDKKVERRPCIS